MMLTALLRNDEEILFEEPLHIAERIANTITDLLYKQGTWKVADLRAANFSYDDIARHLPEACKIVEQRPRPSQR
jgi:hypothetical protein